MRAWYMDDSDEDKRKEHMTDPPQFVDADALQRIGVHYWKIDTGNYEGCEVIKNIREENRYNFEDEITCQKEIMPNYEQMLTKFFEEHIHTDDETRLVIDGSGYFDVRHPSTDRWIRISVTKSDMISIPPGLYHRFTLDEKNYIKAKRYFAGTPMWTPLNRPQDNHPARIAYLSRFH